MCFWQRACYQEVMHSKVQVARLCLLCVWVGHSECCPWACALADFFFGRGWGQRLGYYDPLRKETNLNAPAIKKWLEVGAQPSETVGNLLRKAMIIDTPAPPRFQQPAKEEGEARGGKKK